MKISRVMRGAFLAMLAVLPQVARAQDELRDPGVLYFDETLPDPVELKLLDATDVYSGRDWSVRLVTLPKNQTVRVMGMDGLLLSIQTVFAGNKVTGWVEAKKLPPLDPKLLETARKNKVFRDAVAQAIKDKKVIDGMTLEDVQRSLGKPNRTAFRKEASGRIDTWYYTTYQNVPQYSYTTNAFGQTVPTVVYVRVPVGETVVEFSDSRVTAVEQHIEDTRAHGVTVP